MHTPIHREKAQLLGSFFRGQGLWGQESSGSSLLLDPVLLSAGVPLCGATPHLGPHPSWTPCKGVRLQVVHRALAHSACSPPALVQQWSQSLGDLGLVAESLWVERHRDSTLSCAQVVQQLRHLCAIQGQEVTHPMELPLPMRPWL